jgi:serine/threonine-protein kinase HipA
VGVKPEREFFLLAVLGADLPGAVVVTPRDQARDAVHHEDADDHDDDRNHEPALRFSLAGVRLKFSAVIETSGGLTFPPTA